MLRSAPPPGEFAKSFLGRLSSMAATHEFLSHGNWTGADLRQLVQETVRGQSAAPGAISIDGPDLRLTPNAAATLGMAIYELATNAVRHGALTSPKGRVEVRWKLEEGPEPKVVLSWTEHDGPGPKETFTEGFGIDFVKSAVRFELQGSATVETNAAGVRWTIEFAANGNIQS